MTLKKYSDLYIEQGALALNTLPRPEPELINTRASIAQDVKHMLLESGLVTRLLAQRNAALRNDVYTAMELLIETDVRLVPGSIVIDARNEARILVTATTYEFGTINTEVSFDAANS